MKKVWAVLLAAALLLGLAVPAVAADIVASGTCGDDLTWTLDSEGTLTISGTGEMWDFAPPGAKGLDIIYAPWNWYLNNDGNPYPNPTAIIQPGVTSIGDYAFSGTDFTSVTVPASVTYIGHGAFASAKNIYVDSGNPAFSDVDGILFSRDVTVLYAYPGRKDADAYMVPDGVTGVKDYAFYHCLNLSSITIPESVTSISVSAFYDCWSLESIHVASGNSVYSDVDGVLFSHDGHDGKALYYYPEGKNASTYEIPDGVTSIGDMAFYWRTNLMRVTIPDSVTSIGNYAFYVCFGLTSITIPDSVTSIGEYAFSSCSGLTSITIPDGVTSIGDGTFSQCDRLSSVTIPDTVTSIGSSAFSGCWNLTNITIPDSVTSIGDEAFYACGAPFGGDGGLTSVTIPKSVTHIGEGAFSSCSNLVSVYVVSGNPAYSDVNGVLFSRDASVLCCYPAGKEVDAYMIPNGVISIDDKAFSGNGSLTSVTIPDSVTSIGDRVFFRCDSLTDVYYGGTQQQWDAISIAAGNDELLNATIHFLGNASDAPIGPAEICGTGDSLEAWVLLSAPEDSDMTVYGACFADDGRFLGLTRLTVSANTNAITHFSFADGTSLRIFATDEQSGAPLCDSVTILRPGET